MGIIYPPSNPNYGKPDYLNAPRQWSAQGALNPAYVDWMAQNDPAKFQQVAAANPNSLYGQYAASGGWGGGAVSNPVNEQYNRNQQQLAEIAGSRSIFPNAMNTINSDALTTGMRGVAGQIAANPVSISDTVKNKMIGVQTDEAARGYNDAKQGLVKALSSAGMADSPTGIAKMNALRSQLSAQTQGIRRDAEVTQATSNLQDRISSLGALGGAQGNIANQTLAGAQGQINTIRYLPIPNLTGSEYGASPYPNATPSSVATYPGTVGRRGISNLPQYTADGRRIMV